MQAYISTLTVFVLDMTPLLPGRPVAGADAWTAWAELCLLWALHLHAPYVKGQTRGHTEEGLRRQHDSCSSISSVARPPLAEAGWPADC